ncbi:seipin isoform X2 [Agelaius phoeniceus]|uniref:seipin isoform X2 n=1 Tax=Agelaius phoeniceus TaxID=39638 RepID=UPI004054D5D9
MASGGLPAAPPPPLLSWGAQLGRGARRALLRGALGLSLALLLLWASVFLYGSFYWAYLPAAAVLRPLHLVFRSDCERPGPELCSLIPTANVSLLGEHREKLLLYGQLYRVSLELELPESPVNRELGMFMVGLSLYGNGGKSLARSERAYSPTVGALVEIRSRRVQLYGARLRVHAHFSGLRYLLYHFPLTSAVVGVAGNWTLLALLTLGGYLQWGRGPQRPRPRPAQEQRNQRGTNGEGEGPDLPDPPQNSEEPEIVGASEPGPDQPLLSPAPKEGEGQEEEEEEGEGQEEATPTPLPPVADSPSPLRQRHLCSSS